MSRGAEVTPEIATGSRSCSDGVQSGCGGCIGGGAETRRLRRWRLHRAAIQAFSGGTEARSARDRKVCCGRRPEGEVRWRAGGGSVIIGVVVVVVLLGGARFAADDI